MTEMMDDETLGQALARLRVAAGVTQAEAAERLGVRRETVWRWESGRHRPSLADFIRLARAYGTSPGLALSVMLGERRQVDLKGRGRV